MERQRCSNCYYALKVDEEESGIPILECQRLPPTNGKLQPDVQDYDWCGEWRFGVLRTDNDMGPPLPAGLREKTKNDDTGD